jgi:hypothetical protein
MPHSSRGPIGDAANVARGKPAKPTAGTVWDAQTILANTMSGVAPDVYERFVKAFEFEGIYKNKELAQKWKIAKLEDSGSTARQKIASKATRYTADRSLEGIKYKTDAETGLDYLKTAATMRGPENYLQQADFLRGASQRQDVPIFLQNLARGTSGAAFQAPGGAPQGATMANLIARLGGNAAAAVGGAPAAGGVPAAGGATGTGPSGQDASFLNAARQIAQKGFHTLAPGTLESLDPNELGALKSAVEYSGDGGPAWSWDSMVRQYRNAGIGQGDANLA